MLTGDQLHERRWKQGLSIVKRKRVEGGGQQTGQHVPAECLVGIVALQSN
jgi:hypothetical protein